MANFSKLLSLINGASRTVDFSNNSNILELGGGGLQLNGSTSGHVVLAASAVTSTYSLVWPAAQAASPGYVLSNDGTGVLSWVSASAGSVTSVALADSTGLFNITGSPVTSSGTLTLASFQSQTANSFFAAPNGSSGAPTFRAIVAADVPTLNQNTTGTASNITASSNSTLTSLPSLTSASALATVGTITSGTWNATTIAINHGGTGQTSAASAFAALSPLTTAGDLIYENSTPAPARLAIGSTGQILTVVAGLPAWATPATSGTVTSVALADGSTTPIYTITGSPVTSSGTLTQTLATQTANKVFAGPASGGAAQPTFRSLVSADIPDLSATYVATSTGNAAGGYPVLDGAGKVAYAQLPSALMTFKGAWDASTNTPTLADGTGLTGDTYRASVAGTQNLGSGPQTWAIGDFAIYNGTIWQHSPAADGVSSVNGSTGAVTVNAINQLTGDVTTTAASQSQSKAATVAAIQGTTVSGTTGTGNVVFSASPTLTGTLTAATISASGAVTGSNLSGTNTGDQTITLTGDVTGSGTGSFAATIAANAVTTTKINNGAVTAAKLGTVTDGITADQNGSGSTIEVLSAPAVKEIMTAGEAFAATTLWAVRMAKAADSGFVAGRVYKADDDTTSADNFYVIGLAYSAGSVSAAGAITVTKMGLINVPSHGFTAGAPLYLGASGAITATAPSTSLLAVEKVGMVRDANNIEVQIQLMGIN